MAEKPEPKNSKRKSLFARVVERVEQYLLKRAETPVEVDSIESSQSVAAAAAAKPQAPKAASPKPAAPKAAALKALVPKPPVPEAAVAAPPARAETKKVEPALPVPAPAAPPKRESAKPPSASKPSEARPAASTPSTAAKPQPVAAKPAPIPASAKAPAAPKRSERPFATQAPRAKAPSPDDDFPLPDSYDETRIVLLVRDPEWAYVYWDVSAKDRQRHGLTRDRHRKTTLLRVHAIEGEAYDGKNALGHFDIEIDDATTRSQYLKLEAGRSFVVEFGYCDELGRFVSVVSSAPMATPSGMPASVFAVEPGSSTPAPAERRRLGPTPGRGAIARIYELAGVGLRLEEAAGGSESVWRGRDAEGGADLTELVASGAVAGGSSERFGSSDIASGWRGDD